jgi:hypothetical protein
MVPFWAWSWVLTAIGVTGLWIAGSQSKWGWAIGISAQGLWIAYALATEQYGFLASALVYGSMYVRNFLKWHRASRENATYPLGRVA